MPARKGTVASLLVVSVFIFIAIIVMMTSFRILGDFETEIAGTPNLDNAAIDSAQTAISGFNIGFVLMLVGGFIATIISSFMIRTHPAFFIVSLLFLGVSVTVAAVLSNIHAEILGSQLLSGVSSSFNITTNLFENLPVILSGVGLLVLIVIFGRLISSFRGGDI